MRGNHLSQYLTPIYATQIPNSLGTVHRAIARPNHGTARYFCYAGTSYWPVDTICEIETKPKYQTSAQGQTIYYDVAHPVSWQHILAQPSIRTFLTINLPCGHMVMRPFCRYDGTDAGKTASLCWGYPGPQTVHDWFVLLCIANINEAVWCAFHLITALGIKVVCFVLNIVVVFWNIYDS